MNEEIIKKLEELKEELTNDGAYYREVSSVTGFSEGILYAIKVIERYIEVLKA